jgi:glycine/D-amino acid oxidase-like deaminating enzyme
MYLQQTPIAHSRTPLLYTTDEDNSRGIRDAIKSWEAYCSDLPYTRADTQEQLDAAYEHLSFGNNTLHSGMITEDAYVVMADRSLVALRVSIFAQFANPPSRVPFLRHDSKAVIVTRQEYKINRRLQEWIVANGGKIMDGTEVTHVEPGDVVSVTTSTGQTLSTRALVVCAGAWAKPFLTTLGVPEDHLPLKVTDL